jgi:hypothetical protein
MTGPDVHGLPGEQRLLPRDILITQRLEQEPLVISERVA